MHERAVRVGEGALVDLIVERVVAMMELEGEENESTGANVLLTASQCLCTNLFILLRLIKGDRTFHWHAVRPRCHRLSTFQFDSYTFGP